MISFITESQWALAQRVGEEQHRKGVKHGLKENKASRRTGAEVQTHGLAGEIAVHNAFGLPLPRFKIGHTDGGFDLVTPSGYRCQIKTPENTGKPALFRKHEKDDIIRRLRSWTYLILVWPIVSGSEYQLVGWMSTETAVRVLRLWMKADGALEDCYWIDQQFFQSDWMKFIRLHFFDWVYADL